MDLGAESELLSYLSSSTVDGLVISNTTVSRDNIRLSSKLMTIGGLSGAPLRDKSRSMLQRAYPLIGKTKPIVASGGINSGEEAYMRICMGASLCQIYTAFIYRGPELITSMIDDMQKCMLRDGFSKIEQAKGFYYV